MNSDHSFHLDFERPIVELEKRIDEMQSQAETDGLDLTRELHNLEERVGKLRREIYSNLTRWQRVQISRHPQRPYALDYIQRMLTDFTELHGDRFFGDDQSVIGGPARLDGEALVVVGIQSGRNVEERKRRNFGMPHPEGYRKALRLMQMAAKFRRPVLTLVDTSGAFPGIEAEERGQAEAIGRSLYVMSELRVPIVCTVIGEGGSGGALAIAVGDVVMMMQYATYSVISPEGCASILWKSADKAAQAAETLGITATRLKTLGLIDRIVGEPLGGAHRDPAAAAQNLGKTLQEALRSLAGKSPAQLVEERQERLMSHGKFKELDLR